VHVEFRIRTRIRKKGGFLNFFFEVNFQKKI